MTETKEFKMKSTNLIHYFAVVLMSALLFNQSAMAADVKITPLGERDHDNRCGHVHAI
jgi:hypothetical protein